MPLPPNHLSQRSPRLRPPPRPGHERLRSTESPLTAQPFGSWSHHQPARRNPLPRRQSAKNHQLWESPGSTSWTIIFENSPELTLSPGNRTVYLRPLLPDFRSQISDLKFLSGIGLHPFDATSDLPSPRLFPLGQAQSPPALWPHDGILPLASLLRHRSLI